MARKRTRLIYELTTAEQKSRFSTVLIVALNHAITLNQPIVYRNELCVRPGLFIHQYPDGKKLLIEQDADSFSERTVKVLS